MDSGTGIKSTHLLLLEDDRAHQDLVLRAFRDDPEHFRVSIAATVRHARELLGSDPPDLIIADWILPDGKGLDILPRSDGKVTIPLIIMTSFGDERLAVEIMKSGAIDYVVKSATMFKELPHTCRRALREWENIHERMRAEESVQETQKRLADILDFLPDAVLAIDNEGNVIAWNNAIEQMTGVAAADMLGKGDHEHSLPFYGERRPILIDLILTDNAEIEKKYDFIRRDGERLTTETFVPMVYDGIGAYLWATATPLYDSAGNRTGAIEIIRNITARKKAEKNLQDSEEKYRNLAENVHDGVYIYDGSAHFMFVNHRAGDISGYSEEELLSMNILDIVHPDDQAYIKDIIAKRFGGLPAPETYELRIVRKDGVMRVLEISVSRITFRGEFATLGAVRDITDRKKAEQALTESERKYRFLIDNVRDIVWQTTPDLTFTYVSAAAEILTGYSPDDLIGTSLFGILTDRSARVVQERLRERMDDYTNGVRDLATIFEVEILIKDGGSRWFEISSNAVFGPGGTITGFQGISRDITERRQVEDALRESETRFRDLFNNMSAGVMIYEATPDGKDFIIRDVNRSTEKIEHVKKGDIAGKSVLEVFPSVVELGLFAVFQRVERTGVAEAFPVSMYRDNRISGWRENYVYKLPSGEIIAIYEDVTEKKQAEEKLRESEEKYHRLYDSMRDAFVSVEMGGRITSFNEPFQKIVGYEKEELHNLTYNDLTPEKWHTIEADIVKNQVLTRGYSGIYEKEYRRKDGTVTPVELRTFLIKDDAGNPQGMSAIVRDITERKRGEEIRKAYEARLDSAMEIGGLAWWEMDLPDGAVRFDDRKAIMLGYPPGQFKQYSDFTALLHPDDREPAMQAMQDHLEDRQSRYHIDYRIRTAAGNYRWFRDVGGITRHHPDGSPATITGIVIDITVSKQAEETLRATETRYRALIQNSSDIIRILDREGLIVYESASSERILGYPRGYLTGKNPLEYIHPDDIEHVKTAFREVIDGVNPGIPTEFRIRKADGEYIWVNSIGTNLLDVPGVNGIVITTRPIQQRKEAEQALRENQARLATAMDIAGLVNWEFDVATGMFTFDDRFYALYATTADQEGGNRMSAETYMKDFVYPDDRPMVLAEIQKLLATTDPAYTGQQEHRITPRDGSVRTIIARYATVMGPEGKVLRTQGASQDITDFKLMESEIRSLNTVLEQRVKDRTDALLKANEALEAEVAQRLTAEKNLQALYDEKVILLKEIHHRVKNNLQIIASLLNLQSRYIKDELSLSVIRESQNRVKAMALVHEKLYRSEDISHISLNDYIRYLGTGLFQFYDAKLRGIQFRLEIQDVNVDIDAAIPLGLILNELISNSLKYAFPDGRKGEIAISVTKREHTLTVLCRDNGIGIPGDLDWRDTQSLGLRLVNTLVDQLNGTVELDRSSGTLFTMVLHEKEQRGPS